MLLALILVSVYAYVITGYAVFQSGKDHFRTYTLRDLWPEILVAIALGPILLPFAVIGEARHKWASFQAKRNASKLKA